MSDVRGIVVRGDRSALVVAGLARALSRRGIRAAPFAFDDEAEEAYVTTTNREIGRPTGVAAEAAGVDSEAAMNPLVTVRGRRVAAGRSVGDGVTDEPAELLERALGPLAAFDVVVAAATPTLDAVGGGLGWREVAVEAAVTDFPADPIQPKGVGHLDLAVVALPHLTHRPDLDPLLHDPSAAVRWVTSEADVGTPDLIVVPGSDDVVADLAWLRETGLARVCTDAARGRQTVVGVGGGYQMLGLRVADGDTEVRGLALLAATSIVEPGWITRRRSCRVGRTKVVGFTHQRARVSTAPAAETWLEYVNDDMGWTIDGISDWAGRALGTTVHGLFDLDGFRRELLADVAARQHKWYEAGGYSFAARREAWFDGLADAVEAAVDVDVLAQA